MTGRRWIVLVVLVFTLAAGFGVLWVRRYATSGTCAAPITDRLDPRSLQHFLPGAVEPTYATDPPTSGPHQPGRLDGGVLENPLSKPLQVGALEAGQILLQYRDLSPVDQAKLATLASPVVIVAPNPTLAQPVVASAWRTRQFCDAVDIAELGRFVHDHAGADPARAG